MTMLFDEVTTEPATRVATPCVSWDATRRHCTAGLLFGVACCATGDCALCARQKEWMRAAGFAEDAVERSVARTRRGLLDRCPTCGFPPPPPPVDPRAPLPRFPRAATAKSGSTACGICGRPLARGRRRYCSASCERLRDHHGAQRNHVRES